MQICRNGIIESVDAKLIDPNKIAVDEIHGFSGSRFDCSIYRAISSYISSENKFGIEPPFLIMLSLLGVSGYVIYSENTRCGVPGEIDRDVLQVPEIMVESFGYDHNEVMKQILDMVWNAAGYLKSYSFDEKGEWINGYPC